MKKNQESNKHLKRYGVEFLTVNNSILTGIFVLLDDINLYLEADLIKMIPISSVKIISKKRLNDFEYIF